MNSVIPSETFSTIRGMRSSTLNGLSSSYHRPYFSSESDTLKVYSKRIKDDHFRTYIHTCEIRAIVLVEHRSKRMLSRRSNAVASAGLPYTTACSPDIITLPGAETIIVESVRSLIPLGSRAELISK